MGANNNLPGSTKTTEVTRAVQGRPGRKPLPVRRRPKHKKAVKMAVVIT